MKPVPGALIGRLPVDDQLDALRAALARNELLMEVLARAAKLDLPGWYLTAGRVFPDGVERGHRQAGRPSTRSRP
ncbi:hypothetical protein ABZ345_13825 [Lentzea sp. NPDC005914]|uniref:hypothetical protein n=1 Tax=Lentzea sp. NPDC005914 TaxID=3154572 RepID=UPI003405991F